MKFNKTECTNFEDSLKERGYTKYIQHYNNEDYMYWKSFDRIKRGDGGYSVGFAFYDFSKYPQFKDEKAISIQFHFMLGVNENIDRLDFTVSDDRISVDSFEEMCKNFFEFYNIKIKQ